MSSKSAADDFAHPPGRVPPAGDNGAPVLDSRIVVGRDRPAECTLFPARATDHDLMTHWLTAREGSFIPVEECR